MHSFFKSLASSSLVLAIFGISVPVSAQEVLPEDFAPPATQIDITGGLADRSAQYGAQAAGIPMTQQHFQAPAYAGPAASVQPHFAQQQYPSPMAGPMQPGVYQQESQFYQQVPQQAMQCGAQWSQAQQPAQQESLLSPGLTQQAVGLMGAAALMQFMGSGGMGGLFDEMKARGWNNRFTTRGSCIGGNLSF